jgi:ATP-binding cassette subfamily B protein
MRSNRLSWSAPPDPDDLWEPSSYSTFALWLVRGAMLLLAIAATSIFAGVISGNEVLLWGGVGLLVPATTYLVLVHAWAWARAALEELSYGDVDPAEVAEEPRRPRLIQRLRRMARREQVPMHEVRRRGDVALSWRLMKEVRRYWPAMLGVFMIYVIATPIFLLNPLPLKIAVDSVLDDKPLPGVLEGIVPDFFQSSHMWLLVVAAILQLLAVLLGQLQALGSNILRTYAGERMTLSLRSRMFRHLQRLSLTFHDTHGTADSVYRVQYDAPSIQHITIDGIIPLFSSVLTMATAIYVAAMIDWQLSVVALMVAPLLFMSSHRFRTQMRPHYLGVKTLESNAMGVVQEVLTSVRVVKAFGREDREHDRFIERSGEQLRAKVRLTFAEGVYGMIASLTVALGTSAILFVGVRNIQANILTLGEFLVVMGYIGRMYQPLRSITKTVGRLQQSFASAERSFEILDREVDVKEKAHALPLSNAMGEIEFKDVTFAYEGEHEVIKGMSFHIDPGSRVGIAGRTGAGKSTMLSLLMRFYDPTSGAILLDNVDLRDYKLTDLRDQYALVLQDPVLFSTSIAENIRYGRPDATDDEVRAAAEAANAHDFISKLPAGYGTLAGERGMKLSGGERQRISLARAFLKNAPILILDEPTSSVDTATEATIMDAMERLMEGRTSLMIAHRLSTLDSCDTVLLVENRRARRIERGLIAEALTAEPELDEKPTDEPSIHTGR